MGKFFWRHQKSRFVGESHLHPSPSVICLIHQHLSVQPNKLTPITGRDPRMTGEISLGAKNSSSKTSDTFSLVRRCHRCAVFFMLPVLIAQICRSEPEEAEDADEDGWGLRVLASFRPQFLFSKFIVQENGMYTIYCNCHLFSSFHFAENTPNFRISKSHDSVPFIMWAVFKTLFDCLIGDYTTQLYRDFNKPL